jgi:hypothetical protein
MPDMKSASDYLSEARSLKEKKEYVRALKVAYDGLLSHFEQAVNFYQEMAEIYRAMDDHRMVDKMETAAMNVLYWTKGKVTDAQRAKAAPVSSGPVETHELR